MYQFLTESSVSSRSPLMPIDKPQQRVDLEVMQPERILISATKRQNNPFQSQRKGVLEHLVPHLAVEGDYLH